MKESYFQHSFIEQSEHFKVGKCGIAVFRDMFIAQVDIAMTKA